MNNTKINCSLNDTTVLRGLILANPELPLLIFCGEEAWSGEHSYNQVQATSGKIEELTLYGDNWLDKDDYTENLTDNLCDEEDYINMTDEEYVRVIDEMVEKTEFITAIVIYVNN